MNVVIVDDEPLARERLKRMILQFPAYQCVGEAANGHQALTIIQDTQPDVVLLDIRMAGMDGLQTARALATMHLPPAIIFTTAHTEYALSAFDTNAVAYLLKPIRQEKLAEALQKARRPSRVQLMALSQMQEQPTARTHIVATVQENLIRIPVEEVICFWADHKYTAVHHLHGANLIEDSLSALEEDLENMFVRVHRKALISKRWVDKLERDQEDQFWLKMRHLKNPVPVSRRQLMNVRRLLKLEE